MQGDSIASDTSRRLTNRHDARHGIGSITLLTAEIVSPTHVALYHQTKLTVNGVGIVHRIPFLRM